MPKQLGSALTFLGALLAIGFAASRAPESADLVSRSRGPASTAAETAFRHTEKLHGPIEVTIDLVGAAPVAAGDAFVLRGVITSAQRLQNVEYRWALPASTELVNGEPKGVLAVIDAERAITFDLTLRARDAANAQVHLLANARARGVRFAESAQYNTTKQREFAASRDRLMKSTVSAESAPEELKVFH